VVTHLLLAFANEQRVTRPRFHRRLRARLLTGVAQVQVPAVDVRSDIGLADVAQGPEFDERRFGSIAEDVGADAELCLSATVGLVVGYDAAVAHHFGTSGAQHPQPDAVELEDAASELERRCGNDRGRDPGPAEAVLHFVERPTQQPQRLQGSSTNTSRPMHALMVASNIDAVQEASDIQGLQNGASEAFKV